MAVPNSVLQELKHADTPPAVARWAGNFPGWIRIVDVPQKTDEALNELGAGERDAIILAQQTADALLLIDERRGRTEAAHRGIVTTGTLGVIDAAAEAGLLDLPGS